ncbi:hypothetical protein MHA_2345 [Mannheimia haemolytica PHL213]|nr:hypothetical protein MHA_2345 [Mannheimia haemolytica PHL213]
MLVFSRLIAKISIFCWNIKVIKYQIKGVTIQYMHLFCRSYAEKIRCILQKIVILYI